MKIAVFIALGLFTLGFAAYWLAALVRTREKGALPGPLLWLIGLVMLFLDTLGIGCFAPTTSCYKLWGLVRDEEIPGTLNVGVTIPSLLEGLIFIAIVNVDVTTLVLMIAAAALGAWMGAGVVARWPRRKIQIGMGIALLVTAAAGLATQFHWLPGGGDLVGLMGAKLTVAVIANAFLGALMTLGVGLFAPCMMVTYLLGMNPKAVFPIMMGSVSFLGPVASVPFVEKRRYSLKAALGLTIGGVPGVLLAAYLVRSLPLAAIRWLVIAVVVYTAVMMLRSARAERALRTAAAVPGLSERA
jgi:uncharacterized membrane protein YfcA